MTVTLNAGYFDVSTGLSAHVRKERCREFAESTDEDRLAIEYDAKAYCATDLVWHGQDRILVGTFWRVRREQLPSKLRGFTVSPLGINDDEDLGEATSFAYKPSLDVALIQYNHQGPRHGVLKEYLYQAGFTETITITPRPTEDAMDRLESASLVRKLEFSLAREDAALDALRRVGGAVNDALDAMEDVEGTTISVTISMGRSRGSLSGRAKELVEALSHGRLGIQKLKATVKQQEDHVNEILDLLGGRLVTELTVPTVNREIDHAVCRDLLLRTLRAFRR